MKRYAVLAVSEEEYRRADNDPAYVPVEEHVGWIVASNESAARRKLARLIERGAFPRGSQIAAP